MLKWWFRTLALFLLASAPLYAQKVSFDWDKDVDFSHYQTYKWIDEGRQAANASTGERIVGGINIQLQAKNLTLTTTDKADLYVAYQAITANSGQVTSFNPDGQWQASLTSTGQPSKTKPGSPVKGTLVVDIYDHNMKKLIWRGTISGAFESRQQVNYMVGKGLSQLFTKFPPPPTK